MSIGIGTIKHLGTIEHLFNVNKRSSMKKYYTIYNTKLAKCKYDKVGYTQATM